MSLLMDALKKAELAKRRSRGEGDGSAGEAGNGLELAPLDGVPTATAAARRPGATPAMEILDEEIYAQASGVETSGRPRTDRRSGDRRAAAAAAAEALEAQREAAQNLFEAKQPSGGNKLFAIGVGIFTLLAVAGIGIYFWLQLRPPGAALMASAPAAPTATRSVAAPPLAAMEPARGQTGKAPADKTVGDAATARRAASEPRPAIPEPEAPIRITTAKLHVDPSLTRAYDAVSSGDLGAARGEYEQLLKTEPKNGEALLGMATIAVRQGRNEQAEAYYVRALEADPKNALAQAGLISLNAQADPVQAESRLKTLLAGQPEVAALHFALGNVYVRQARWNEAQQAFFKAFTLDAENPDYLFNLAISLDQLHQAKLAAQYYNQSLAAAAKRPYSFDRAQVSARLRDLQN